MHSGIEVASTRKVSFANILVATDFRKCSDCALEYALSVARRYKSRVYLTHVITLDGYPTMAPEIAERTFAELYSVAEEEFLRLNDSGRLLGIKHEEIIEQGNLWPEVESLIYKHKIDLVVVGTQGVGDIRKLIMGSRAEEIFRHVRVPVLTVGPAVTDEPLYETEFKSILFATDFGPSASEEAAYAFSLAHEHGAKLTMLSVVPYAEVCSVEGMLRRREEVKQKHASLIPSKTQLTNKPEFLMAIGDPVTEILRRSQQTRANLIVMGAKKRESFASSFPHTKVYRVVRGATCPVLTIHS